jgi:hypothetical protein
MPPIAKGIARFYEKLCNVLCNTPQKNLLQSKNTPNAKWSRPEEIKETFCTRKGICNTKKSYQFIYL